MRALEQRLSALTLLASSAGPLPQSPATRGRRPCSPSAPCLPCTCRAPHAPSGRRDERGERRCPAPPLRTRAAARGGRGSGSQGCKGGCCSPEPLRILPGRPRPLWESSHLGVLGSDWKREGLCSLTVGGDFGGLESTVEWEG